MVRRSRFGCSGKSLVPAPYPALSIVIAGNEAKREANVFTMAAPVGVTSSTGGPDEYTGAFCNNFNVAGAGTGRVPWAHLTVPLPTFKGEHIHWSILSESAPTAAHTMSTMASTAPTSGKIG